MLRAVGRSYSFPHISARNGEVRTIVSIARRRWRVFVLTLVVGLVCAQVLLWHITPIYSASVQVLIDPRKQTIERDAILSGLPLDTGAIESEVALMRSFAIATRVVQSLHLEKDREFVAEPRESLWAALLGLVGIMQPSEESSAKQSGTPQASSLQTSVTQPSVRESSSTTQPGAAESTGIDPPTLRAIESVRGKTTVRRIGLTYAIEITFSSPDAIKSAKIANALAQAYLVEQQEAQLEAAGRAADWLSERLVGLRQTMIQSARAVAEYKRDHQMLETSTGGFEKQQLSDLSTQLLQAHMNTVEKKARLDQSRRVSEGGGFNLRSEYEVALKREQELEKSFQQATDEQARFEEASVRLKELEREAESNTLLYQTYLQRFKETTESKSLERRESRVISPAEMPPGPSYPRRSVFFFAAASLSLIVGAAATVLLEAFKNGFSTAEEVEHYLHCPVIATIPTLTIKDLTQDGQLLSLPQYVVAKRTSRIGEAMCAIRLGVQFSDVEDPPRVVMFTSSVTGEGKSILAHSFACSAVLAGLTVAFIDADVRHPSVSRSFGAENARGLSNYLLGSDPSEMVAKRLFDGKLILMPAGTSNSYSPDILGSEKMRDLVAQLKESYDLIVIDTPPVGSVIDATVLAKIVDKIVYVIEWEKVPREVVARAIDTIGVYRDKIAGVILNKANIRKMSRYLPYYSYYNSRKYTKYYDS